MSPSPDAVGTLTLDEVRRLPKVELHAHLSGSITQEKLMELLERRGEGGSFQPFNFQNDSSNALQKCFGYFAKELMNSTFVKSAKVKAMQESCERKNTKAYRTFVEKLTAWRGCPEPEPHSATSRTCGKEGDVYCQELATSVLMQQPTCWDICKPDCVELWKIEQRKSRKCVKLLENQIKQQLEQSMGMLRELLMTAKEPEVRHAAERMPKSFSTFMEECTLHVLDTFAVENCIYLELRTSPKQFKVTNGTEHSTSKLQYLETVKDAIEEFHAKALERYGFVMEVKVLLSIDRGKVTDKDSALAQIDDVLKLQKEYPDLVVGIDICGDPHQPTVTPYLLPALKERKEAFQKLPITFHTAEIHDDEESALIIDSMKELNVRRLGHVTYFPDHLRQRVLDGIYEEAGVGVEVCPTSNMVTKEISSLQEHHFLDWWKKSDKVLLSINTDDVGLFSCDLSSEIFDLAQAFNLSRDDLIDIQRQAISSAFHLDKERVRNLFEKMLSSSTKDGKRQRLS
eukprot:symbB.v1.2.021300.t1/scaffold1835.1/size99432/1